MRDFSIVKQRIIQYLDSVKVSKYEFYQKTSISNGVLSQKTGLSEENILKFLSYYLEVNPNWLLTGKGDMIKDSYNQSIKGDGNYMAGKNLHNNSNDFIINNLKTIIKEKDTIIKEKDIIIKELLAHQKKLIDKL